MRAAMRRWRRTSASHISAYLGFLAVRRAIERSRSSTGDLLLAEGIGYYRYSVKWSVTWRRGCPTECRPPKLQSADGKKLGRRRGSAAGRPSPADLGGESRDAQLPALAGRGGLGGPDGQRRLERPRRCAS